MDATQQKQFENLMFSMESVSKDIKDIPGVIKRLQEKLKDIVPRELKKDIVEREGVKFTKTINDKRIITFEFLTQEDADKYFDAI